jgi:hypothetical protein
VLPEYEGRQTDKTNFVSPGCMLVIWLEAGPSKPALTILNLLSFIIETGKGKGHKN